MIDLVKIQALRHLYIVKLVYFFRVGRLRSSVYFVIQINYMDLR